MRLWSKRRFSLRSNVRRTPIRPIRLEDPRIWGSSFLGPKCDQKGDTLLVTSWPMRGIFDLEQSCGGRALLHPGSAWSVDPIGVRRTPESGTTRISLQIRPHRCIKKRVVQGFRRGCIRSRGCDQALCGKESQVWRKNRGQPAFRCKFARADASKSGLSRV